MEYIAKRNRYFKSNYKKKIIFNSLFSYCRKEKEIMTTRKVVLLSSTDELLQPTGRSMFSGNILRMELPLNPSVTMDRRVQFLSMGGEGFSINPRYIENGLTFAIPDNRGGVEYVKGFAVNTAKSRHVFYYI